MPWLQITIASPPDDAPLLSDLLTQAGALAVTFIDAADDPVYQPSTEPTRLWNNTLVTGLFEKGTDAESVMQTVSASLLSAQDYSTHILEDEHWETSWMDLFKPMPFGENLWVCPSWVTPPQPNAINILIDPGLAFGTGTHESTALCLQWLASNTIAGKDVIDFGCGSGILAIAALKLGASHVWAIDNDPQALTVTAENAANNNALERLAIDSPAQLPDNLHVDIVLANILAQPLIDLASMLSGCVKPGGNLVLAGLLTDQVTAVKSCYQQQFSFTKDIKDGWVMLSGLKNLPD